MTPQKTTIKKIKNVGVESFINASTGELIDMNVTRLEDRDFNFTKVWLQSLLADLDIIGNKKFKVANYIFDHLDKENRFIGTQRQLAKQTGVSYPIVSDTMTRLMGVDLIRMQAQGVYIVNPDKLYKGTHNQRMSILKQYSNTPYVEPTIDQQIDQLSASIEQLQKQLEKLIMQRDKAV